MPAFTAAPIRRSVRLTAFIAGVLTGACGPLDQGHVEEPVHDGVPVAGSYLWLTTMKKPSPDCGNGEACFSTPDGLVTPLGRKEALERYYPASKQASSTRLLEWMALFGFPHREENETLAAYRQRAKVSVYYNVNELGLGREIGCTDFDESDQEGRPARGLACYVTNYGTSFNDPSNALHEAELGAHYRATVAISYQPSLPAGYQVQFAAFDADTDGRGHLADAAQLDTMGARPVPQICTNCHGGVYDPAKHLAQHAHFLPLNPFVVAYDTVAPYRQEDQLEAVRYINRLAFEIDLQSRERHALLTPAQKDYVRALYGIGNIATSIPADAQAASDRPPPSWNGTEESRTLWRYAILPYCATCHAALPPTGVNYVDGSQTFIASWLRMKGPVCRTYSMPHAQPTLERFWTTAIDVGGKSYPSPKAFLAMTMNGGTDDCEYQRGSGCSVGNDQAASNARCGDPTTSGRYCNLDAAEGEGRCETGCGPSTGGVGCANIGRNWQQCGTSGRCEPCGREGQPSCSGICTEGRQGPEGVTCLSP